ncbi:aspartic proteinase nepenthesin-1-like [Papaver somniferum]|uniref:aspartic proteinase nepenthesin-1-like n=1 Tax=Papaver somniferum TaxID=3469 RepID=UPI000E704BF0|nr:aspartic proteinase nepenthesin-1-like [Papaver somniferum]
MIRSDSKESPLHPRYANLTQAERFRGRAEQSKARVRHFGSARAAAYNQTSSMNPNVVPVKYVEDRDFYIGEVGIGTFNDERQPFQNFYLMIDTGSDLIWTQCRGGGNYFYQDTPFYDQTGSTTYKRIPCEDLPNQCNGRRCINGFCTYKEEYGSGQLTYGHLAYETFTTGSTRGQEYSDRFVNIIMGCGLSQRHFGPAFGVPETRDDDHAWNGPIPAPGTAPIAGFLGLGQGASEFSLVLQLDDHTDKQFEYCLASYDLEGADVSPTYLRFGSDVKIFERPAAEILKTPIIQDQNFGTPYHLSLLDISVNNKSVGFQKSDFEIRGAGIGGTIIDSGTPLTTMIGRHYERVEQALIEYFEQFGIRDVNKPNPGFDICFRIPNNFNDFPTMTFHFEDADFVIKNMSGLFVLFGDKKLCLGIVSSPDDPEVGSMFDVILGAMQQSNKRILYDVGVKELAFAEEECNLGS